MRWRFWSGLIAILGVVLHAGIAARHNAFLLGRAGQHLVGVAAIMFDAASASAASVQPGDAPGDASQPAAALAEALLHDICSASREVPRGNVPSESPTCPVCAAPCPSTATLPALDAATDGLALRRATTRVAALFDASARAGRWSLKPPGRGPPRA